MLEADVAMVLQVTADIVVARKRPLSIDPDASSRSSLGRKREHVSPKCVRTKETPGQRLTVPLSPDISIKPLGQ